jgi:hypothetical protein
LKCLHHRHAFTTKIHLSSVAVPPLLLPFLRSIKGDPEPLLHPHLAPSLLARAALSPQRSEIGARSPPRPPSSSCWSWSSLRASR